MHQPLPASPLSSLKAAEPLGYFRWPGGKKIRHSRCDQGFIGDETGLGRDHAAHQANTALQGTAGSSALSSTGQGSGQATHGRNSHRKEGQSGWLSSRKETSGGAFTEGE